MTDSRTILFDESRPIAFQDELPGAVDVVVIGGGVAGICTAYYLARQGVSVLVCEKGRVAGEQSSRNWGWIRQQGRDADEVPLAMEANRLWGEISEDLDEDIGFARTGVVYTARDAEQLAGLERWLTVAEQHQLDTRMLSAAEVDDVMHGPPNACVGGLYTPSDAKAEPSKAVPAVARAVRRHGGLIRENCAVRSLVREQGQIRGVVTEHGEVAAQSVVCAGGAWSSRFLANIGIGLPQLTVRATVVRTAPGPELMVGAGTAGHLGVRRRQDGGYTIATGTTHEHYIGKDSVRFLPNFMPVLKQRSMSVQLRFGDGLMSRVTQVRRWRDDEVSPFERTRILNPPPSKQALLRIEQGIKTYLPALERLAIEQAWAGMIDVTPDVVPVLDRVLELPDLYVATGFSGHGFGIGPATGKTMADMVLGKTIGHDLTRFRFTRFTDGSPMRPGPGL